MTRCCQCADLVPESEGVDVNYRIGQFDTFCDNLCRANAIYDACDNATAQAELKKLVAALSMFAGVHLDRIPALANYGANECIHKADPHAPFHVIELDKLQVDARAMLAQIGDFAEETPKWAQDAINSAEDCAALIGEQVVNG